jgi:hypothetical protein
VLLTTAAALGFFTRADAAEPALQAAPTRDRKVVRRFALPGDPRGLALGADGTAYVGLAKPQAVIAVDPATGVVRNRVVLDSAEIASTKELVTLRTNRDRTRLYIANGSDESATILSLPDLGVIREITMEGETIRDVVPDPRGRYVYLLGRSLHVFDAEGDVELRTLDAEAPMAIATTADGSILAVVGSETFDDARVTSVWLYDTSNFNEISREPLQTEDAIELVMFADRGRSLVAFGRNRLYEKRVSSKPTRITAGGDGNTPMQFKVGDVVNGMHACLPESSGPQIATATVNDATLVYGERRCAAAGSFTGSNSGITPASLYGISAYALTYDAASNTIVATDRAGFLTVYNVPRPAIAR